MTILVSILMTFAAILCAVALFPEVSAWFAGVRSAFEQFLQKVDDVLDRVESCFRSK